MDITGLFIALIFGGMLIAATGMVGQIFANEMPDEDRETDALLMASFSLIVIGIVVAVIIPVILGCIIDPSGFGLTTLIGVGTFIALPAMLYVAYRVALGIITATEAKESVEHPRKPDSAKAKI